MSVASSTPATGTGTAESVVVSLPSCPLTFPPQQTACPELRTAHACAVPTDTAFASVGARSGSGKPVFTPIPCPQHVTAPELRRPQVRLPFAERSRTDGLAHTPCAHTLPAPQDT